MHNSRVSGGWLSPLMLAVSKGLSMSALPQGTPKSRSLVRVLAIAGCVLFLALAFKIGVESFRARSAGAAMSNWKGGTMAYQDGFKLTVVCVVFAGLFCYVAVRPEGKR